MKYNEFGEELPDDSPVEIPLRFRRQRPPSIQELIALYVRNEQALARQTGKSEADEEEDFDVDEDGDEDILTPYELHAISAELDSEVKKVYSKRTVDKDRTTTKESKDEAVKSGVADGGKGADDGGKVGAEGGEQRGSAGSGGK